MRSFLSGEGSSLRAAACWLCLAASSVCAAAPTPGAEAGSGSLAGSAQAAVEGDKLVARAGQGGLPCPAGLGDHWRCRGATRSRCVDGVLQEERCAEGCIPLSGELEAVCSCGQRTSLRRWNCLDDGNLHACRMGGWATESCGGAGCEVRPMGTSDVCNMSKGPGTLQTLVTRLGQQCSELSPGSTCSISVRDLVSGENANWRGTVPHEAASTVKSIWVALALYDVGPAPLKPYVQAVFANSDNGASGKVIDLLSSPERINSFMWHNIHMPDSGFCKWNSGGVARSAPSCEARTANGFNYLASNDALKFLTVLWDRSLIGEAHTRQLLEWMLLAPRTGGPGGWFGTQLPAAARARMYHKGGWVPPSTSHEIGIVEVPDGHAYAAALLFTRADGSLAAYNAKQVKTLEYASCVVYHAVAKDVPDPFGACQAP